MEEPQDRPSAEEIVLYSKDPETKIATITLDRAEDLNAMTVDAQHRYADLIQLANIDDNVKVLVIRATGENLGSGADLPELMAIMAGQGDSGMRHLLRIPEEADIEYPPKDAYRHGASNLQFYADPDAGMRSLQSFKKISILEVHGYCYGWHFYQAADADIVISSEDALFGHAAFRYAGYAARMWQWCSTMGVRRFMEMVFTGRPFTAKEMYDCDFVNTVVPFDQLESMTEKYALACARSRPTDTIFAQKTFFEIYKQHQGEYMGSLLSGLLESLTPQLKADASSLKLDKEMLERGLTNSVRDNDERFPPEWRLSRRGREAEYHAMVVLTNARVFNGTELLPGTHDVTFRGRRIASVDDAGSDPGDDVVDLGGMTLLPGLITSHLHPDFYKYELTSGDRPGKERPPGVMMAIGVRTCRLLLESGFTGYSGAACAHDIDAQLKMAIREGIIPGPRIRACGHHLGTTGDVNNESPWWKREEAPGVDLVADGPDGLRRLVREEISRGVETIKIFASTGHGIPGPNRRNLSQDEIATIVETAHQRGAKVRAHVADRAMIHECLDLGVDVIDHGDEVDDACIEKMVAAGTFWVPSLVYLWSLLEIGYAPHFGVTQENYDHVRTMLPIAHRAGVRILLGDDYSGVFRHLLEDDPLDHEVGNYGRELAFYSDIDGLTPADVLAWGTSNAGQLLVDPPERVGVIEPGALADLIVVDGDPLTDPTLLARPQSSLRAVIRDGAFAIDRLGGDQGRTT